MILRKCLRNWTRDLNNKKSIKLKVYKVIMLIDFKEFATFDFKD
jgi:hypothetical protein